ncbi:MAG: aldehyde dehydrogenase family protein, partial [Aestuariibacter sp.]|nr:aldehyde dehydrogenase family protein [Aestuariibacter sp.]
MSHNNRWTSPDNLPQKMFINGQWVDSVSGRTIKTIDPATGSVIGSFPEANSDDVDRAVTSASAALSGQWRATTPAQRARILSRTAALIRKQAERLSSIETLESGKP